MRALRVGRRVLVPHVDAGVATTTLRMRCMYLILATLTLNNASHSIRIDMTNGIALLLLRSTIIIIRVLLLSITNTKSSITI